jgi:hypothetical protein
LTQLARLGNSKKKEREKKKKTSSIARLKTATARTFGPVVAIQGQEEDP